MCSSFSFRLVALCAYVVVGFMGCTSPPITPVNIFIPAKFHGPFIVHEDATSGVDPWEGGRFVVRVPEEGVVQLTSCEPLRQGFIPIIEDGDGQVVPFGNHVDSPSADMWAVWMGTYGYGSRHGPRFHFFVGTKEEFEAVDFDGLFPGVPSAGE